MKSDETLLGTIRLRSPSFHLDWPLEDLFPLLVEWGQLHQQSTHTKRLVTKQTVSVIGKLQGAGSNANFSGSRHWKTY